MRFRGPGWRSIPVCFRSFIYGVPSCIGLDEKRCSKEVQMQSEVLKHAEQVNGVPIPVIPLHILATSCGETYPPWCSVGPFATEQTRQRASARSHSAMAGHRLLVVRTRKTLPVPLN